MDNDLISRSALKETMFQNEPVEWFHPVENREWRKHFQFIENAPAVDAVAFEMPEGKLLRAMHYKQDGVVVEFLPVVRCKDCVKRGGSECPMLFPLAYGYADFTSHNGYCDRGERRSEP